MGSTMLLTVTAALLPAPSDKLEFSNIRSIYGQFGPARPDWKVWPGDMLSVGFDITGLHPDAKGKIRFYGALEVKDEKGEVKLKKQLAETRYFNVLAGRLTPHAVEIPLAVSSPPGKYTLKTTISDVNGGTEASFEQGFEIRPPEFALVRCQLTYDIPGQVRMPNVGAVGQVLFLNVGLVGFKRDANDDNQGAISVEMKVYDERGLPTAAKGVRFPERGKSQPIPEGTDFWHVQFDLPLNRAGEFTVELKATDHVGRNTATLTLPVKAIEAFELKGKK